MKLSVVTASRLRDGTILWLGAGPAWRERFADAQGFDAEALDMALQFGAREVATQRVIGVYAVDVEQRADGMCPLSARERIRAEGPSVRPELGYVPALVSA
jgi:sulfite reductase (NADPH) hemoprotein beta-component